MEGRANQLLNQSRLSFDDSVFVTVVVVIGVTSRLFTVFCPVRDATFTCAVGKDGTARLVTKYVMELRVNEAYRVLSLETERMIGHTRLPSQSQSALDRP
jgi:hypothetical protein